MMVKSQGVRKIFGRTFYYETIRKYIVYFGTLMNDIHITREDSSGNVVSHLKIPLTYAPKDKMIARTQADPTLDRPVGIVLPRMSFEVTSLNYDSSRKVNTIGRVTRKEDDDPNIHKYLYNAVPYDFNFTLWAYVKNAEDGTKIVEQILPYFTPEWNATLNLIPEMDIVTDTPIFIKNVGSEDVYEGNFDERRVLIWTLDFVLKGQLWGPVCKSPIIKFANINFYNATSNGDIEDVVGEIDPISRITVQPGLDANGNPTTNAAASISRDLIEVEDDWAYIITPSGEIINQ